ncbi:MAG: hypothetical protein FD138_1721 [Planctomycetota bacterium]|nr:MAG: hypothetical protein FD138_1721 [Planctomycetota bacterium]
MDQLAGFGREDFHESRRSAERDPFLIRTDVGREHAVGLVANLGDSLAGRHIEQHRLAGLGPVSPRREQQLAVAAELQDVGNPFRERQYADQLQVIGVVKQDTLMPRDRDERSPRAGRERRHRMRSLRRRQLHRRQLLRHRRRTFRLTGRDRCQIEIHFASRILRRADRCLRRAKFNPFFDDRDVRVRNLRRLRRHERLFDVSDRLVQPAGIGTSRRDRLAAAAAGDQRLIRHHVEVRRRLVRIVAVAAMLPQNRRDVVLVGDNVLGLGGVGLVLRKRCGRQTNDERKTDHAEKHGGLRLWSAVCQHRFGFVPNRFCKRSKAVLTHRTVNQWLNANSVELKSPHRISP